MKRKEKRKLQVRRKLSDRQPNRVRELGQMLDILEEFEQQADPITGNIPKKEES